MGKQERGKQTTKDDFKKTTKPRVHIKEVFVPLTLEIVL